MSELRSVVLAPVFNRAYDAARLNDILVACGMLWIVTEIGSKCVPLVLVHMAVQEAYDEALQRHIILAVHEVDEFEPELNKQIFLSEILIAQKVNELKTFFGSHGAAAKEFVGKFFERKIV